MIHEEHNELFTISNIFAVIECLVDSLKELRILIEVSIMVNGDMKQFQNDNDVRVKILAMYLPQYHVIPENSKFWGEGFTDWVSVKNAEPLIKGHNQPVVPLNNYYYDLSQKESISWQISLAKEYGIYGFGIYHYWFSEGNVLLTKPAEIILNNKDLSIPFFFAWDNANWRRTWSKYRGNAWAPLADAKQKKNKNATNEESSILIKYELGDEKAWKAHFMYLLPYFKDERYIKVDECPLFEIFNYTDEIYNMSIFWDQMAKENGLKGIKILYKKSPLTSLPTEVDNFFYEPQYSGWSSKLKLYVYRALSITGMLNRPLKYSYDKIWRKILENASIRTNKNEWHGAFVGYDDTPRRGVQGRIVLGASPEKFEYYLKKLKHICQEQGKEYIMLTAWNEWGEGAKLEPDTFTEFEYLEAVKRVMEN